MLGLHTPTFFTLLFTLARVSPLAHALPPFNDYFGRGSLESMVSGAAPIEAMGPTFHYTRGEDIRTRHLGSATPGAKGNATILVNEASPPLFFVQQSQLYLYTNETTIFPVNVYNTTCPTSLQTTTETGTACRRPPLQVVIDDRRQSKFARSPKKQKKDSLVIQDPNANPTSVTPAITTPIGGSWRWSGSTLHYDFPGSSREFDASQGLFYSCEMSDGSRGVFMFGHRDNGAVDCDPVMLYSFTHSERPKLGSRSPTTYQESAGSRRTY